MKKAILFTCFTLIHGLVAAQTMPGIRLGGSLSKINGIGMTTGKYDWVKQLHGGLVLQQKIGDKLYLQPEAIYSQKGYTFSTTYNNAVVHKDTVGFKERTNLAYLEFPVLLKLETKGVYFEAGPQLSYLLSCSRNETLTTSSGGVTNEYNRDRDVSGMIESVDIGFALGLGYQTKPGFGIGLRYNQGFREIINKENWKKNIVLQLSTFYLIGKRKEIKSSALATPGIITEEYYKKNYKKSYKITNSYNMPRVTFTKISNSEQQQVQINIISTGAYSAQDILLSGNTGIEENSALFLGFRNVVYPFKGSLQFSVPNSIGIGAQTNSRMEYEINEPGVWLITITVGR